MVIIMPVWQAMPDRHQKSMEPALNTLKGVRIYLPAKVLYGGQAAMLSRNIKPNAYSRIFPVKLQ